MLRGHPIYFDEAGRCWRYADNDEPTAETCATRPCGVCGEFATPEGHDPCIGTLPGVMNACCGHGQVVEAYIQFPDGSDIRGVAAVERMNQPQEKPT